MSNDTRYRLGDMATRPIYEPLSGGNNIRILNIFPSLTPEGLLRGYLLPASLGGTSRFNAISYTWGDPQKSRPMILNDHVVGITESLHSCLHQECRFSREAFPNDPRDPHLEQTIQLWVDALCINQSDDEEKAQQIPLMRRIYETAFMVSIHLGDEDEDSKIALRAIQDWGRELAKTGDAANADVVAVTQNLQDPFSSKTWLAIERFFGRPWWGRLWTLQEVVVANDRQVYIWCGSNPMNWYSLLLASRIWFRFLDLGKLDGPVVGSIMRIRQSGLYAKSTYFISPQLKTSVFRWVDILYDTSDYLTTDPKDKLLAVWGLAEPIPGFQPSYAKSTLELFSDFTRRLIQKEESLDILTLLNPQTILDSSSWPSWVPQFHRPSELRHLNIRNTCSSSLGKPTKLHIDCTPPHIRLGGHIIGTVSAINNPQNGAARQSNLAFSFQHIGSTYQPLSSHLLHGYFQLLTRDFDGMYGLRLRDSPSRFKIAENFYPFIRGHIPSASSLTEAFQQILNEPVSSQVKELGPSDISPNLLLQFVMSDNKPLFITANGYMGIGPECEVGDVVCVLFGASVPFILRRRGLGYVILGQCFVPGAMHGEALEFQGETEKEESFLIF